MTDRILFRSSLTDIHTRTKRETKVSIGGNTTEFTDWTNEITLDANLSFYIENQLQLNISIAPSLVHLGDSQNPIRK